MRSNNFDLAFQRDSRPTEVADRGGQRLCLTFEDGDFELESKGIPGRRLRHLAEDCGLEIEGLEEASLLLLRFESAIRSLPFAVLLDRQELSTCLLAVALWDVLPHSELRRELRHWGLANGGAQKTGQTTQLVDALWTSLAEARRVPVRRFAPHVGLALVGKAVRLEASCSQLVEGEYRRTMRRLGLPADAPPQSHIQCIMLALVLEEASMMQLKEECRFLKLEATNRPALQQHLFVETLCRQRWEDEGLSVSRLGYEAAIRVKLRWQQLELMDGRQLLDTWQAQGFTDEIQVSDMREKLKATALWKEMPVALLQEECRDLGLPIGTSESELLAQLTNAKSLSQNQVSSWEAKGVPLQRLGSQQDRIALVLRLETLETLSHPELRREYQEATALPPQAASVPEEPGELIQRLRQIYIWKALPLNQLRSECHDLGISQHLEVAQPEEKHQELLERLLLRWADRWKEEGIPLRRFRNLRSATNFADKVAQVVAGESGLQHQLAAASGLPQDAFGPMGKQELIKHMKDVFLWKELSVDELREECLQRSLSWRAEGGQEKLELLERLVMACCAQAWEDQGLPVKRLSSAHAAQQLLERWRQLDACGVEVHTVLEAAVRAVCRSHKNATLKHIYSGGYPKIARRAWKEGKTISECIQRHAGDFITHELSVAVHDQNVDVASAVRAAQAAAELRAEKTAATEKAAAMEGELEEEEEKEEEVNLPSPPGAKRAKVLLLPRRWPRPRRPSRRNRAAVNMEDDTLFEREVEDEVDVEKQVWDLRKGYKRLEGKMAVMLRRMTEVSDPLLGSKPSGALRAEVKEVFSVLNEIQMQLDTVQVDHISAERITSWIVSVQNLWSKADVKAQPRDDSPTELTPELVELLGGNECNEALDLETRATSTGSRSHSEDSLERHLFQTNEPPAPPAASTGGTSTAPSVASISILRSKPRPVGRSTARLHAWQT